MMVKIERKTLLLLRHAKAAFIQPVLDDFDRPLDPDGYKSLRNLLGLMHDAELAPQVILCSPSRRTRETLDVIRSFLPGFADVYFEEDLYLANLQRILTCLEQIPDHIENVMVIGHNPGLDQLLAWLLQKTAAASPLHTFPTAGLAHLRVDTPSWFLKEGLGSELVRLVTP